MARTDGVPLFVEELTRMLLESGLLVEREGHYELNGPLPPLAIPSTLRDSLMARLDRLANVKEVAQLGAVLGRSFSYELLQAVSTLEEGALQAALVQLAEAGLIYQRGVPPQATYLFKHALIQDAAYQSLLRSRRQQLHERSAQVLLDRFPELVGLQPELLAHHYTEAGVTEEAVAWWQRAGERALQRTATKEAISHFTRALDLLPALPDGPEQMRLERKKKELALLTLLGPALMITEGFVAARTGEAYWRSYQLSQELGDPRLTFTATAGLWQMRLILADYEGAVELGEQLLEIAQASGDPELLTDAHCAIGEPLYNMGRLDPALRHFDRCQPGRDVTHALRYGHDPGAFATAFAAITLWLLGFPELAQERANQAVTAARTLGHPPTLTGVLAFSTWLHGPCLREPEAAQRVADECLALASEHGLHHWTVYGNIVLGWSVVQSGNGAEGLAGLRDALATQQQRGSKIDRPFFLTVFANTCIGLELTTEGLGALAEAEALARETGDRTWEAELHRLNGELLLLQSAEHQTEAEVCFRQAIEVARGQAAKSLELRAATSLARLWQQQGRREEARRVLAEIYGWFTEGFDTADLQEARALLAVLT
ncbi:MAG: ATP-binding protein [Dehalococcoidia bacterium]